MSERRTRFGGAARRSGPQAPSLHKSLQKSPRKSDSEPASFLPEIWRKAPQGASTRKPIVLKKIVAHAVEMPAVHSPRRSPRIAFLLEKENNPPQREPAREDLFKSCSVPTTPTTTPVLCPPSAKSTSRDGELDARDLEMSQKVRRSYSRLEGLGALTTSTPGRWAPSGFSGADDLSKVSPVVAAKSTEVSGVPAKPWALDTALPGISPLVPKEKRKKKKVLQMLSPGSRRRACCQSIPRLAEKAVEAQAPMRPTAQSLCKAKQSLDMEVEPTVTFLLTLLNTPEPVEPKLPEVDLEIQEKRLLEPEDLGCQQASQEIRCLQEDCRRLREALKTTQADNLALGEKLQGLATSLYNSLKVGAEAIQAEVRSIQAEVMAGQEEGVVTAEAMPSETPDQPAPVAARESHLLLSLQPPSSHRAAQLVLLPDMRLDTRSGPRHQLGPSNPP
ncbi:sororin isoform X2 [Ochotona princeps]|uniref:sororin isoform X2 n=1 Tax=Ochotona princeps TaxID=9978 RepID=UPI0027150C42|nr:sororin isoform X2 [Ochotona princeps]